MLKKFIVTLIFILSLIVSVANPVRADHGECEPGVPNTCPAGQFCQGNNHICVTQGGNGDPVEIEEPPFDINTGPTNETFNAVNPLKLFSPYGEDLSNPGGILTRVLTFAFPIAGMILFVMIIWGGFEILAGAQEKKSLDSGKNRVTAAIIGFILLFSSYWIAQIIQEIFGIAIL